MPGPSRPRARSAAARVSMPCWSTPPPLSPRSSSCISGALKGNLGHPRTDIQALAVWLRACSVENFRLGVNSSHPHRCAKWWLVTRARCEFRGGGLRPRGVFGFPPLVPSTRGPFQCRRSASSLVMGSTNGVFLGVVLASRSQPKVFDSKSSRTMSCGVPLATRPPVRMSARVSQ